MPTGVVEISNRPFADKHLFNKALVLFFPSALLMMTGKVGEDGHDVAEVWLHFEETTAKGASTHPDEATRVFMQQLVTCGTPWELCVRHKERFSYDRLYGEKGALLRQAVRSYDYDVHHQRIIATCVGIDCGVGAGTASMQLANHYGDLRLANWWMDRCMHFTERMLAEPNRTVESFTLLWIYGYWGMYAQWLGRQVRCTGKGEEALSLNESCAGAVPGGPREGEARLEDCRRVRGRTSSQFAPDACSRRHVSLSLSCRSIRS